MPWWSKSLSGAHATPRNTSPERALRTTRKLSDTGNGGPAPIGT
ncbi:MAG TPA: hypothetical protein VMH37_02675 [Candidatus Binataceae bacterium]|nr:hypothetical protein [Candidatus Binataceae bacterium]